ncbi:hypothetical protein SAMN05444354_1024 [Stigmatella aurantiaca]|uniref:Lipoprotein n=1 Tax=Stigmatella aurantiaca TaxID=41 RepID=A0A1H7IUL5_STIAU|nr:hypothetical protein [Stigmatella aurantiaca]SEK65340.1 hypothetical protein SAMN05444354_1024 [Stigmatella aurantiaca]
MKAMRTWASVCALAVLPACGDDQDENVVPPPPASSACAEGQAVCEVSQNITEDTTWTKDHTYVLTTNVFVERGTLTIEAGTVIQGRLNSSLAITRNAKLAARGTAAAPIVFTSAVDKGSRQAGNWGGLVLLGKAPINVQGGEDNIEGYPESENTRYGGTDAAHNCGTLQYARIEFAGFRLGGNNELNGLTLGACGTATTVDYVQVHRGLDDGVEMFGGTANLKHIVVTLADDDGLDWDQGWQGKAQFVAIQLSRLAGNNGIEADNSSASPNATPRSSPTLWNVTLVGADRAAGASAQTQGGAILRVGSAGSINNSIIAYFNDFAIDIAGPDSIAEANAGRLIVSNSTFWSNKVAYGETTFVVKSSSDGSDFSEYNVFLGESGRGNSVADPKLGKALYKDPTPEVPGPSFKPEVAIPGGTPPNDGFFDTNAGFQGAVGETDWTAGWTAYPAS